MFTHSHFSALGYSSEKVGISINNINEMAEAIHTITLIRDYSNIWESHIIYGNLMYL